MTKQNTIMMHQDSTILVQNILKRIGKYSNIPKHGIVAGGCIASAIFEELNIDWINPVYNDIDIFYNIFHIKNHKDGSTFEEFLLPKFKNSRVETLKNWQVEATQNVYGSITIDSQYDYEVMSSRRYDMLNIVYCKSFTKGSFLETVVDSFDINSIKVGIDLSTNRLYATSEFWKFLETKQLEIDTFHTPNQSFIRLVKKQIEYGSGVFCDLKLNAILVSKAIIELNKLGTFGIKAKNTALDYIDIINKSGFYLKAKDVVLGGYPTYYLQASPSLYSSQYNMFYGSPWSQKTGLTMREIKSAYKIVTAKKSFKEVIFEYSNHNRSSTIGALIKYRPSLFTNSKDTLFRDKKMIKLMNHYNEHDGLAPFLFNNSIEESMDYMDYLATQSKTKGLYVFGLAEDASYTNKEHAIEQIVRAEESMSSNTIEPFANKSIKTDTHEIVEMTGELELIEEGFSQQNCIGGYFNKIKSYESKLISVRDLNSNKRISIEVKPITCATSDEKFSIAQAVGKANANCSQEELKMIQPMINDLFDGKKFELLETGDSNELGEVPF